MKQINSTNLKTGECVIFMETTEQRGEVILIEDDWLTLRSPDHKGFDNGKNTKIVHISDLVKKKTTVVLSNAA